MTRHLLDAFLQNARHQPNAIALRSPSLPPRTWAQLVVAVDHTRQRIEALKKKSWPRDRQRTGDYARIAYESRNTQSDVLIALGCIAAGVIEIPIDSRLPQAIRQQISVRCAAMQWDGNEPSVSDENRNFAGSLKQLERCAHQVDILQPSLVLWTSGTTDQPRGVMLSQRNLTTNAQAKLRAVPQSCDDVRLTLLSIAHAYARTCDMGTWLLSGCAWTLDYGQRALDRIGASNRPTMINCVPVLARIIASRLADGDDALSRLSVLGCGGAAMDADLFAALRKLGVEVIQGYGCTETSPVICSSSPGSTAAGLVGPPVERCEVRIEDRRLYVRGPHVMLGYLDNPKATAAKIDSDGWLDTGDLAEIKSNGQLKILGRADDVIVLENGFKLYPLAIEQEIQRQHGCEHAVVLAVNDKIIVGIQSETLDSVAISSTIRSILPANTQFRLETFVPPLSLDRGELTAKKTPRRSAIRQRFSDSPVKRF